jgi:hypothetical protein
MCWRTPLDLRRRTALGLPTEFLLAKQTSISGVIDAAVTTLQRAVESPKPVLGPSTVIRLLTVAVE